MLDSSPISSLDWHLWAKHLEQGNLVAGYNVNIDWWKEPNRTIVQNPVAVVLCPSSPVQIRIQDKPEAMPPNKTGVARVKLSPSARRRDGTG